MDLYSILKGLVNDLPSNFQKINFQRNQKTKSLKVSPVAGSQLCCALDPHQARRDAAACLSLL